MNRIEELKQIIRENQPLADWGHAQARFNVVEAQAELDRLTKEKDSQAKLFSF
tara:strand:- start:838 stop:996 length:159 start_codon:yes stop_codon:yes gene_type:complete